MGKKEREMAIKFNRELDKLKKQKKECEFVEKLDCKLCDCEKDCKNN